MTKKFNQYLGKAGHLTIMSEFLMLGRNVAIPEVDIFENNKVGSLAKGNITFYFSFTKGKAECSGQDFTGYIKAFTDFPKIEH